MIINSLDKGKASLVKRMEEKHSIHTVYEAASLGIDLIECKIIDMD